jgi:Transposase DDE domain
MCVSTQDCSSRRRKILRLYAGLQQPETQDFASLRRTAWWALRHSGKFTGGGEQAGAINFRTTVLYNCIIVCSRCQGVGSLNLNMQVSELGTAMLWRRPLPPNTYDILGNLINVTDTIGNATSLTCDSLSTFFADLIEQDVAWITRLKSNAIYTVQTVLLDSAAVRDQIIQLGGTEPCRQPVRLVEVRLGHTWYRYLTSVLDPTVLSAEVVVDLYRRRWRIEEVFLIVKRLLNLSYLWTGSVNGVLLQVWSTWLFFALLVNCGTGFTPAIGPFGFWIWCEADSNNPYHSRCNGAMYFYALFPTQPAKHVAGTISEGPSGIFTMSVASSDGSAVCTLKNLVTPPTHGPSDVVSVTCSTPNFSGVSTNAVINVTGP